MYLYNKYKFICSAFYKIVEGAVKRMDKLLVGEW